MLLKSQGRVNYFAFFCTVFRAFVFSFFSNIPATCPSPNRADFLYPNQEVLGNNAFNRESSYLFC